MKKFVITFIGMFLCALSYAQERKVMYVSVIGEDIAVQNKHIIEDHFHDLLKNHYEIRLDQGNGLFSQELYNELHYQELGSVSEDEIKQFGLQKGADLLCVVIVESARYNGQRQYYFRAKIYDVETATLRRTAVYPNSSYNDHITKITDIDELQYISSVLLQELGYDIKVSKIQKYKGLLEPSSTGGNLRFITSFSRLGVFGLGFYFNKSYFQLGFDLLLSNGLGSPSELDDRDMDFIDTEYNQDILKNDFILLEETETSLASGAIAINSEYIYPRAQFSVSPGVNLKYLSVECGLGAFLCENVNVTYNKYNSSYSDPQGTKTTKAYFLIRPTVVGIIPFSKGRGGLSVSLGYNIVPNAAPLNGIVMGLGFTW